MSGENLGDDLIPQEVIVKPTIAPRYSQAARMVRSHVTGSALNLQSLSDSQLQELTYVSPSDFEPELADEQAQALVDLRARARTLLRDRGVVSTPKAPSAPARQTFLGLEEL